jgi:peptidoglycan/xylan/chitin deacetylase (PgdA/CDA1 family)
MDWPMLKDFAREPLVTIGAHTNTHPRLRTLTDEQSRAEIAESKARIEKELQREIHHFAYPVGDPTSAGKREFAFAAEVGCVTGVTTRPGVLFPEHAEHLHALPRLSVNGLFQNPDYLRALITGLPLMLKNRGRRLNVE